MESTPAPARARSGFTGRRRRKTRRSVRVIDTLARSIITTGGIGVIAAFATIVLFLLWVVVPLFKPAQLQRAVSVALAPPALPMDASAATTQPASRAVAMEPDENLVSLWVLDSNGTLNTYRIDGGEFVSQTDLSDVPVTAISNARGIVAIGREDGTARVGEIRFEMEWMSELTDSMEALKPGESVMHDGGVAQLTPIGQVRVIRIEPELSEPLTVGEGEPSPVRLIDYVRDDTLEALVAMRDDGRLFFSLIRKKRNMMTGQYSTTLNSYELPWSEHRPADAEPMSVLMGLGGRMVYLVYADGHVVRYNTANPAEARIVEETDVLPDPTLRVTAARMLLGNQTLIIADDAGGVSGWFAAPYTEREAPQTPDRLHLVQAHRLPPQDAPVTSIATSSRDRQFITGDARGTVLLRHMTSGTVQGAVALGADQPVALLAIAPKNNAITALDATRRLSLFALSNPHPEGSLKELFLPVHYEGYPEPMHVWQSSAGTDDAEPKHGLTPLIFGTFKATLYALLFAVPVALLAAVYSSEFMQPRVRSVVKPLVEMMAGLPSVVLGFVAALVLAPLVEDVLPALLLAFAAIPIGVALFGYAWQVLPPDLTRAAPTWVPFATMLLVVMGAIALSFGIGHWVEQILFFGSIRGWLSGRLGDGTFGAVPGWIILLTPLIATALVFAFNLHLRPRINLFRSSNLRVLIAADVVRFAGTAALAIGLACLLGAGLSAVGLDLRDGPLAPFGSYVQRNTLIVGMVMGFAVIPIIYTVSEDALSSVPTTLRSAALGAGATPWQTATRVVIPVAMSGIFSACMIGLGRAAGETMIVLMAAGNTPLLDLNMFSGARTLSANVAVELPEAPVASTHFRILFLTGLVLFAITFVVNTTAEIVRARFRKRAYQL